MLKRLNETLDFETPSPGRRRQKREDISDALSANVTMILEDLLKDYDKTERPAFNTGNQLIT